MKKRVIIINGPNLNLLGKREPEKYGHQDFDSYFSALKKIYEDLSMDYFHSNVEGELINKLHEVGFSYDAIVMNPGGYSHTSVALSDAIIGIKTPVIEVHITNIYAREDYRHVSLTGKNCIGCISGFGLVVYEMALEYVASNL